MSGASPRPPSVAAVVVTYNRRNVFPTAIDAILAQTYPVSEVIIVDNASPDDTEQVVKERYPHATYLKLRENLGAGAGLQAGMKRAIANGHDYCFLMDDDSVPAPEALAKSMAVAEETESFGIVGFNGGDWDRGPNHWRVGQYPGHAAVAGRPGLYRCGFVLVDGSLVSRRAVEAVGYPRNDFFMMFDDMEYPNRIKRGGFEVLLHDREMIQRGHLGSGKNISHAPPWRAYYMTRNHLAMALELGSPRELLWWGVRQAKACVSIVLHLDRKTERLGMRLRGALDAVRGKMGRTVEPSR
jgi:rhamnopyranosyl-N-acetylglucosaminyl-diphospho-decaprenol beta-1,3/1,4-galactofuranosyltransferase